MAVGVATGGTRTLILPGFSHNLLMKDSSRSSESLPKADNMNDSSCGGNGGVLISASPSEKAVIPVLEVNAMAENSSRGDICPFFNEKQCWIEAMVCEVDSTMTVGHQRGAQPLLLIR